MPDGHSPDQRDLIDLAYARWLIARGKAITSAINGGASEENRQDNGAADKAAWDMVRLPAQAPYQIKMKLGVYRETLAEGETVDGLEHALLASIERDLSE